MGIKQCKLTQVTHVFIVYIHVLVEKRAWHYSLAVCMIFMQTLDKNTNLHMGTLNFHTVFTCLPQYKQKSLHKMAKTIMIVDQLFAWIGHHLQETLIVKPKTINHVIYGVITFVDIV
jgi:hypothetical protein